MMENHLYPGMQVSGGGIEGREGLTVSDCDQGEVASIQYIETIRSRHRPLVATFVKPSTSFISRPTQWLSKQFAQIAPEPFTY